MLYLVQIHEDDFDYDRFETAVVWAYNQAEAEAKVRASVRLEENELFPGSRRYLWIEDPAWKLVVKKALINDIVHAHSHPG